MALQELREKQSWTLPQKVQHAMDVISTFVSRMGGLDKVYISWSGGKDSTVLLDIARRMYPDILAVFCATGNEYPDIMKFVRDAKKDGANIQIIRPKMTPREVWAKYGFPLVGKELSYYVHQVQYNPDTKIARLRMSKDTQFGISEKWKWLVNEPYAIHNACCDKLKKEPMHRFDKESGRSPIIGTMASESRRREKEYLKKWKLQLL